MLIYLVILHYGKADNTLSCLRSITKLKKDNLQIKVILVDNNSTSEESWLRKLNLPPSEVITIKNLQNLGFAGGINIGIKEALKNKNIDYILILNNDTILPKNFLQKILINPDDITAPVIKFKFKSYWVYDYGGKINWWTGRTKHLESSRLHLRGEQESIVDYVSGCCMLIKREVFEKIGLFDERFFFYFEDVDFCVRAKKSGLGISVCEDAILYHKLGASIGRWSNRAILYNLYGNFLFIIKHLGLRSPIGYIYLVLLSFKIFINRIFPGGRTSPEVRPHQVR